MLFFIIVTYFLLQSTVEQFYNNRMKKEKEEPEAGKEKEKKKKENRRLFTRSVMLKPGESVVQQEVPVVSEGVDFESYSEGFTPVNRPSQVIIV